MLFGHMHKCGCRVIFCFLFGSSDIFAAFIVMSCYKFSLSVVSVNVVVQVLALHLMLSMVVGGNPIKLL